MTHEQRIIYIVTGGAYNDYEVCAAFSTREAAEAFLPICADDSEDEKIHEVLVDNPFPPGVPMDGPVTRGWHPLVC